MHNAQTSKVIFEDGRPSLRTCTPCNTLLNDNPDAPRPTIAAAKPPASAGTAALPLGAGRACEHCHDARAVAKVMFEDGRPTMRACRPCLDLLNDDPDAPPPTASSTAASPAVHVPQPVRMPTVAITPPVASAFRVAGGVPMPRQVAANAPFVAADDVSDLAHSVFLVCVV